VTVVILLRFFRRDCHSAILVHVSKIVTFVTFHFVRKTGPRSNKIKQMQKQNTKDT
jgi:hypothetical protein